MGMDVSTYVGVVVKINLTPREYVETINTCPNGSCEVDYNVKGKFCIDCGTAIQPVDFPRMGSVGWQQFMETLSDEDYGDFEDSFYSPEYVNNKEEEILLDNMSGSMYIKADGGYNSLTDLKYRADEHHALFVIRNGVLINRLRNFFGDNRTIETGVISYWS